MCPKKKRARGARDAAGYRHKERGTYFMRMETEESGNIAAL